jgi:hypothetical protein
MSQFYVVRLQEANAIIAGLQDEVSRLREGVNAPVLLLQDEVQQVRNKLAQKASENQDLRHQLEMMQLRLELHPSGTFMPPEPFNGMQGGMYPQSAGAHVGPSAWEVNPMGGNSHTQ